VIPSSLAARDRRALVFGAALLVAIVTVVRGVPALRGWTSARAEAADLQRERLLLASGAAHRLVQTRARLVAARQDLSGFGSLLLAGSTFSAAGAALAEVVATAAEDAEVSLGAVQLRGDSAGAGPLVRIGARTSITGDLASVAFFLALLEVAPELLVVRELAIVQPEPAISSDRIEVLRAELLVEGLHRVRPGADR
jgi:hypothetical protein